MSATKSLVKIVRQWDREERRAVFQITFDTSYLTGGEELDFSDLVGDVGPLFPVSIDYCTVEANSSGYIIRPNQATRAAKFAQRKCDLQVLQQNASVGQLVEIPNGTNLSGLVVSVIVGGSWLG